MPSRCRACRDLLELEAPDPEVNHRDSDHGFASLRPSGGTPAQGAGVSVGVAPCDGVACPSCTPQSVPRDKHRDPP